MERWLDQVALAPITGMVIPAYFSTKPSDEVVRHLLWMTLGDGPQYVPPDQIQVIVDGDPRTARIAADIQERMWRQYGATFRLMALPENRGKLWAIRQGAAAILAEHPAVQYIVIRDGDGDHAASDVPPLVRAAVRLAEIYGHTRVLVLGARRSRHRPMGWVRGELEALLDSVTLDALAYVLARQGRVLDLSQCAGDAVPDLSSGYKVYGREAAETLFVQHVPQKARLSAHDYWHYGPETVAVVEGLLGGVVLAEVRRLTWNGQPTSSFGEFRHIALYGELLAWVYTRLEIPTDVAAQLYDNCTPPMLLRTTTEGQETIQAVREHALQRIRAYRSEMGSLPPPRATVPFV